MEARRLISGALYLILFLVRTLYMIVCVHKHVLAHIHHVCVGAHAMTCVWNLEDRSSSATVPRFCDLNSSHQAYTVGTFTC